MYLFLMVGLTGKKELVCLCFHIGCVVLYIPVLLPAFLLAVADPNFPLSLSWRVPMADGLKSFYMVEVIGWKMIFVFGII